VFRFDKAGPISTFSTLLRLWTLRPVTNIQTAATDRSLIGLGLASLAFWVALDRWRAGPGAVFEPLEAPLVSVYFLLVLSTAFVAARASRPHLAFRGVLFTVLAFLPILIAAGFGIDLRLQGNAAVGAWLLLALYGLLYGMGALRAMSGAWQGTAAVAVIMLLGVFSTAYRPADLRPSIWSAAPEEETADADLAPGDAESLLFDQREAIDEAVDRMAENLGPKPAIFFVGFAGVSSQRVFAQEIKLAAQVVGDRFDAAERELLLINDRRDLDSYPLATLSGLQYALSAVAQKMDPDRDILFLALSSHGSRDPELAVSNGGLPLAQVSADDLKGALEDSGIKRRIIVISACYAGGFIPSLENPDTIVIAAAAPDRTSFGCSDDRDLTYFGEAFYRDSLPHASSLEDAFARAKTAIAAREKQENEIPSDPQAFFGGEIRTALQANPMRAGARGGVITRATVRPADAGYMIAAGNSRTN
jgi:hypothetical protein